MRLSSLLLVSLGLLSGNAAAWSKEDHEIFRVKAEIDATEGPITFYEFINCPSGIACTQDELRAAFKKTGRQMHPDKFQKPTKSKPAKQAIPKSTYIPQTRKAASERYARLTLVSNILKGPERARYDHFLRNGFPMWKGTNYYYSRFRPGLGTVLIGLFLVFGGVGHYGMQVVSYRQQRRFMQGVIEDARHSAWGSTSPVVTLDALTGGAAGGDEDEEDNGPPAPTNRKERRAQQKSKGGATAAAAGSGTSTPKRVKEPSATGHVAKRKVTAPNGKTFMVTQLGDVFLVDEDEDGNNQEFLLDLEEIPKPSWGKTAVVSLPGWIVGTVATKLGLKKKPVEDYVEGDGNTDDELEEKLKKKGVKKRKNAKRA